VNGCQPRSELVELAVDKNSAGAAVTEDLSTGS
jgi:hypothetical protein